MWQVFTGGGYRVPAFNNALGPIKVDFVYHPTVDIDAARPSYCELTWKTSLGSLPMSGAKGGYR